MTEHPEGVPAATAASFGTETAGSMAVSPVNSPGDHAACDAEIARLRAALRRHCHSFTDHQGAALCGGCLREAPCEDAALAGEEPS